MTLQFSIAAVVIVLQMVLLYTISVSRDEIAEVADVVALLRAPLACPTCPTLNAAVVAAVEGLDCATAAEVAAAGSGSACATPAQVEWAFTKSECATGENVTTFLDARLALLATAADLTNAVAPLATDADLTNAVAPLATAAKVEAFRVAAVLDVNSGYLRSEDYGYRINALYDAIPVP